MQGQGSKFDYIKKIELGLQERVDTGLGPSFYAVINTVATTIGSLEGLTDMRPQLFALLAMGYVGHKRNELTKKLEDNISARINETKESNGGTVTNEERGRITLEESVKVIADIIEIFDKKSEQRQSVGLMIPSEDMDEIDVPPMILDFNSHEKELLTKGIKIKKRKGVVTIEDGIDNDD